MKKYKIEEVKEYFKIEDTTYSGINIKCSDFDLFFGIAEFQACCEEYGHDYIQVEEDLVKPKDLVGGGLMAIRIGESEFLVEDLIGGREVNDNIYGKPYDEVETRRVRSGKIQEIDSGNSAFLRVITDKGDLVARVYNEHNGYYAHNVIVGLRVMIKLLKDIEL